MRKGEQTRQEIIRKAAPIFNQRGYDGAALSDLSERQGWKKVESTGTLIASNNLRPTPSTTLGSSQWMRASKEHTKSRTLSTGLANRAELSRPARGPSAWRLPTAEHCDRFRRWQSSLAREGSAGS